MALEETNLKHIADLLGKKWIL